MALVSLSFKVNNILLGKNCRKFMLSTRNKWLYLWNLSGLPPEHSAFLLFPMRCLFHISLILSNSLCSIPEKQNFMYCLWWFKFGSNRLSSCKSLKKLIHQVLFFLFKIDHNDSIRWLFVELPNKKLVCPDMESWYSPLKYRFIPATTTFSLPLSPLIVLGTHFRFDIQFT